jgi:GDP-4-dehydro-6-deoxy-D-mannose reductase
LTDYNSIQTTIEESQPDYIFHLAAQTFVPTSWRAPQETMNTNVLGTLNLLEAVRKSSFSPRILICGSSEEYGMVNPDELPIKETNELRPMSPYAVSKIAEDLLGYQYFKSYSMKIIRTRAFNIIGPRSGEKIVTANFAKQISFMKKDFERPLLVGDLSTIRDFNDVRDICDAYWIALFRAKCGEVYNISTGIGHTISEIIDVYSKLSPIKFSVKQDNSKLRPSDVPVLIGDSTKFRKETDWKPKYIFEESLKDVLEYWRN